MKPKYLEFVGLNSFQEIAKIDFDKLFEGGLFGVFGKTGAGKTTILDAISYALYGEISRKKIGKNDFINKNCKKMFVYYSFEMQEKAERVLYRVERTRSKSSTEAILYRNNIAIVEKQEAVTAKIKEILGLTYDEFNKCIILPQGEFTQFIKQGNKERVDLICKLFNLQKYIKLEEHVRESYKQTKAERHEIESLLATYSQYTEEQERALKQTIKLKTKQQEECKRDIDQYKKELEILQEEHNIHIKRQNLLQQLHDMPNATELTDMQAWLDGFADMQRLLQADIALEQEEKKVESITGQIATNQKQLQKSKQVVEELIKQEKTENFAEKKMALNAEKTMLASLKEIESEIEKQQVECKKLQKEISLKEGERQQLSIQINRQKERIANGVQYINAMPSAADYLQQELGGALLQQEFTKSYNYFIVQKEKLLQYKDNSPLYQKVESEIDRQIAIYQHKLANYGGKLSVDTVLVNYKKMQEEYKKYEQKLEELKTELASYEKQEIHLQNVVVNLKENIAEKEGQIEERGRQITAKLQGKSLQEYTVLLQRNIAEIEERERALKVQLEEGQAAVNRLQTDIKVGETEQKNSLEKIDNLKSTIKTLLSSLKYDTIEKLRVYANKYKNEQEIRQIVQQSNRCTTLLNSLPQIDFSQQKQERFASLKGLIANLQESLDALNNSLGANAAMLTNLQQQLQQKSRYLQTLKDIEERYTLIESLNISIQSNKFVTFIANSYLKNICQQANATLLQLTDNRYYLEFKDEENDFFVLDNFNDNEPRKIHTLSGGESFLVSLALALALSSTIYQHSLNPIEFFFLDEGFGTLDSELVETVLDALTQLKKSNFIIGLISHVEELKTRIPHQLIVYRDGFKGSKVEIKN